MPHSSASSRTVRVLAKLATMLLLVLVCAASGFAQSPNSGQSAPLPDNDETSLFQIIVLIGDKSDSKDSEDIPQNARKALDDIKQFLPYKSYQMVDTALIRSRRESAGRMAGPAPASPNAFEFTLGHFTDHNTKRIHVTEFQLIDVRSSPKRRLLGTSFTVSEKETIVVGTSKMEGGDKALVVLFTAVQ